LKPGTGRDESRCGIAILSTPPSALSATTRAHPSLLRCVGETGHKDDDYRKRSRRVRKQTRAIIETLDNATGFDDIAIAVIEGPIYGVKMLGAYFDRAAVFHGVYGALDARDIPIAVIPPTTGTPTKS
jgi:hypothetical protein